MRTGRKIRLIENPDGQWTAHDIGVGVSAKGATRGAALDALDDVVAAVTGDGGHHPTEAEFRDLGVDPDVARTRGELPDVLHI